MPQMSWSPRTHDLVLNEIDHMLLRRHRMVENNFTPAHINRVTFPTPAWGRVKWLMENDHREAFHRTHRVTFKGDKNFDFDLFPFDVRLQFKSPELFAGYSRNGYVSFHRDSSVAPYFENWVKAHLKIATENMRAYQAISRFMDQTTTWLQIKKHWPELTAVVENLRKVQGLQYEIPDMRAVDASRARNVGQEIRALVMRDSDHTVKTMLQASLLPELAQKGGHYNSVPHDIPDWDLYNTRVMYRMKTIKEGRNDYG